MQNPNPDSTEHEPAHPSPIYQQQMVNTERLPLVEYYSQKQAETPRKPEHSQQTRPNEGALLPKSGLQRLEEEKGIYIKQKLKMLEVVTGCETQNTYFIYPLDKDSIKEEHMLFKCQEKSSFCARNCLSGSDRPFQMTVSTFIRGGREGQPDEYEPFLILDKLCRCTFFCYNRPGISVSLVEDAKNEYIGKIVDPFSCCSLKADVYDKDNQISHVIEGDLCQAGVLCPMPCESCQKVDFEVKTASGEVVSTVQKVTGGWRKAFIANVDNFMVNFPNKATMTQKALLMCAALLLDYSNFEKKPGNTGG